MPTDQYHEPPEELSDEVRTFARMITSLQEECEAIGWYEQRISVEKNEDARAIMENAQQEEFKHFAMSLEFLSAEREVAHRAQERPLQEGRHRRAGREGRREGRRGRGASRRRRAGTRALSFTISRAITSRWISCVPS